MTQPNIIFVFSDQQRYNWNNVCNDGLQTLVIPLRPAHEIRQLGCSVWDRYSHMRNGRETDSSLPVAGDSRR